MEVFFYGLFMDQTILLKNGIEPSNPRKGYLNHYALKIGNRASLIPSYIRPGIDVVLNKTNLKKCIWVLEEAEKEFHLLKGDSSHILRSLLYYSISLIDRIYREQNQLKKLEVHLVIYQFRQLLNRHIRERHTVAEYASALKVSHNHLNTLCKKHLLRTGLQIIHERLLIEAKREVLFSDKTISEISNMLNFSDVANFNRFFKKMTGQTANQFRQAV